MNAFERNKSAWDETGKRIAKLEAENQRLRDALGVLLDQVDYTSGACRINEPIAGVLPAGVIRLARLALKETE